MILRKNTFNLFLFIQICLLMSACVSSKPSQKYAYLLKNRPESSHETHTDKNGQASNTIIVDNRRPPEAVMVKPEKNRPASVTGLDSKNSSTKVNRVLKKAHSYMGTPYRYGGMNRRGIDCSGLVCRAFEGMGSPLPHSTRQLSQMGKKVSRNKLREGDLVFFSSKGGASINHVGIITKVRGRDVEFIHATTSRGVRVDKLNDGYWKNKYRKSVRL